MHDFEGVFVALIFWTFVGAVALVPIYLRYRDRKNLHDTVKAIVANGGTPSDELMKTLQTPSLYREGDMPNAEKIAAAGIIVTCVGIGLMVFGGVLGYVLWFNNVGDGKAGLIAGPIVSAAGFIVLMVGTALRLIGKQAAAKAAKQTATDV